ncbi:leucine--tRNA ligase, partial [Candidatus Woesearchaeota archaeon]|nr:leucine--tRNA ligase [Candidatus Woesearchaeota archaeon]
MVDFNVIAKKWQERWEKSRIFDVTENPKKKKFYNCEFFPYPSSYGLHMGHLRNYAIGDAYARFKRMQGYNVLYPMGYDAFGLPAENAAIKEGIHPGEYTKKAIINYTKQLKGFGLSYDWSRTFATCDPEYYKWNQYFFLELYKKGLAYRKKAPVNFCPKCNTVLANEQVVDGNCWRCESKVEIKNLEQWFFKITDYADEILKGIDELQWPERIKMMQKNWIGKSEGLEVHFPLKGSKEKIPVFTTRPDTLFGVTFLVCAPEHPKVIELVKGTKYGKDTNKFINKVVLEEKFERTAGNKEKEGMFIGRHAINPLTKEEIPIYIANFVLPDYGTGCVMAVPAHDQRDFEFFAKKYKIPIKVVIEPGKQKLDGNEISRAYTDEGRLVNSKEFNGINSREAIEKISRYVEKQKFGKRAIQFKIRDWLISRQRYWGTPIPIIYCNKCGIQTVPEKDLPVLLPEKVKFTGRGNPLFTNEGFLKVKCPKCKLDAMRETDTMDTFVDSSWYFLRYTSNKSKKAFDDKAVKYWMPVDQYIGGAEHAVMHLIYARFFTKVLRDLGYLDFDEPFTRLFNQGIVYKDGNKMSKSFGNVVNPEELGEKYGIDSGRVFVLFVASPDKDMEWSDQGVQGVFRLLNKAYSLVDKNRVNKSDKSVVSKMHKTIKQITWHMEKLETNKALINLFEFVNYLHNKESISKESLEKLIALLSPFAPHLAEEMWEKIGNKEFVSVE